MSPQVLKVNAATCCVWSYWPKSTETTQSMKQSLNAVKKVVTTLLAVLWLHLTDLLLLPAGLLFVDIRETWLWFPVGPTLWNVAFLVRWVRPGSTLLFLCLSSRVRLPIISSVLHFYQEQQKTVSSYASGDNCVASDKAGVSMSTKINFALHILLPQDQPSQRVLYFLGWRKASVF